MKNTSNDIINQVREGIASRNTVITQLYQDEKLRNMITAFVLKNGGQFSDAEDLFVMSVITFIKQCYRSNFELTKTVQAYIFSVSKYEWFRIKKAANKSVVFEENISDDIQESVESLIIDKERKSELHKAMQELGEKCRQVLTLWASNVRMREIALQMEYKSEGMARKKKHECLQKLKVLIKGIK